MTADADNIILQQLRIIRAENEKRDIELALLRAEFKMFSTVVGSKLDTLLSMMSTHTDTLYSMNEKLLVLQRQREGEPG
jgi:hypothetical protein